MATDATLAAAVRAAQGRPGLLEALAGLYAQVDAALAEARPHCRMCGTCCDFETFAHRLYVSTAELAMLTVGRTPPPAASGCPYQQAGRCTVRAARALGCRAFFCQGGVPDLYEPFHRRIQRLHRDYDVAYLYVELTAGVRAVAAAVP